MKLALTHKGKDGFDFEGVSQEIETFTVEETQKFAAASIRMIRDNAIKKGEFSENYSTKVNGFYNTPEEKVRVPKGKILYTALGDQTIRDAMIDTYEYIIQQSKVVTGRYRRHHIVSFNKFAIADSVESLRAWFDSPNWKGAKQGDFFRITNIVPYARRLERLGVTSSDVRFKTRKVSKKLEAAGFTGRIAKANGVYFRLGRLFATKLFKGSASIKAENHTPNIRAIGFSRYTFAKNRVNGDGAGRPYVYPSLFIGIVGDIE